MEKPWLVFFDGACHLCSREIDHYRKSPGSDRLSFIDISEPGFSAATYGLDSVQVNQEMHVISPDGEVHVAMDAFIEIWRVLPRYYPLHKIAQARGIRPMLDIGYSVFAKVRPYLPKRKTACAACETRIHAK